MRISVFGIGYVGCVSAGCLAEMGHEIVAVEPNPTKVEMINASRSPIVEKGLEALIAKAVQGGKLRATSDWSAAIRETEHGKQAQIKLEPGLESGSFLNSSGLTRNFH